MENNIVEVFLKQFMVAWQMARIYELEHPKFKTALEELYATLTSIFNDRQELVIGIFSDELSSGEDIFFDLSRKVIASIDYLTNVGIERLAFMSGISKEELIKFFSFLMTPIDKIPGNPQDYLKSTGIENIVIGKLKAQRATDKTNKSEAALKANQYEACLENVAQSMEALINNDIVDTLRLGFISHKAMDSLIGDHKIFLELVKVKGHDISTFMHLLNVCILSMFFSYKLGFSKEDCLNIGISGLFHDIGKLLISKKILTKPGGLNDEEFSKMQSHTILGSERLLSHHDVMTVLPSVVAFEHHLRWGGGGYPKTLSPRTPHIASQIITICDAYDAFSQRRTYKSDYPSETIHRIMTTDKAHRYSPELLDIFFKIVGVWPKGTIVMLEDQRVAIVREVNEANIFSPKVEIVSGNSKEMVDLNEKKEVKIHRSLNSLAEGEKYLEFI